MTSQKSKSPESIAKDIVCKWRGEPIHENDFDQELVDDIAAAIKAERENNRLVLPERKEAFKQGRYVQGERDWNACLDEIIRLNTDLVSQNEEKKI